MASTLTAVKADDACSGGEPLHPLKVSRIGVNKLREYVLSRRGDDGGFAFCKPLPSSLPETYYAVYILRAINSDIPKEEKLVEFLLKNTRDVYSIFYALSSLKLLGKDLPDISDFLLGRLKNAILREMLKIDDTEKGITATYSFEMPNILREVYMITSSLKLLGKESEDAKDFVRRFKKDGGFGSTRPNLQETYYSIYVLGERQDIKSDVVKYIKKHECWGGFTKIPGGYPPYLEETYYALSSFKLLGYRYSNRRTVDYIASLQNPDGGFRRSIHGGISSLEYTYYAVASLKYFEEEEILWIRE